MGETTLFCESTGLQLGVGISVQVGHQEQHHPRCATRHLQGLGSALTAMRANPPGHPTMKAAAGQQVSEPLMFESFDDIQVVTPTFHIGKDSGKSYDVVCDSSMGVDVQCC